MVFLLAAFQAAASQCDRIQANGATSWYPVFTYGGKDAGSRGMALDVARLVFGRLDVQVEVAAKVPWKRVLVMLEQGRIDLLLGAYWLPERALKFAYSKPFLREEIAVFVRQGEEFPLASLDDLVGREGLRPLGGSYGREFDHFADTHLTMIEIPSLEVDKIVRLLAAGRADYAVLSRFDGRSDARLVKEGKNLVDLPWPVAVNDVHFLFSRNSPCQALLADVDRILEELRLSGELKAIETRYLGR